MTAYCYGSGQFAAGQSRRMARFARAFLVAGVAVTFFASCATAGQASAPADQSSAAADQKAKKGFCTRTAEAALTACGFQTQDDFWIAKGKCINVIEDKERRACEAEAQTAMDEATKFCGEQHQARSEMCGVIGEDRYDPEFDRQQFVDPDKIGVSVKPNPYFPLVVGNRWVYRNKRDHQTTTDVVSNEIKLIDDVPCRVIHDVVEENGVAIEVTDDWVAQDLAGNIWYCGELAEDFEVFKGDKPKKPELVSIDGSFKAGREGDKPGFFVLVSPQVGEGYVEEFSLGNAEDAAKVTSITGSAATPAAQCDKTCQVTHNISGIEPGVFENKYYAPGIGLILEVAQDGNRTELVSFTVH